MASKLFERILVNVCVFSFLRYDFNPYWKGAVIVDGHAV